MENEKLPLLTVDDNSLCLSSVLQRYTAPSVTPFPCMVYKDASFPLQEKRRNNSRMYIDSLFILVIS
jgi:hypothetical protein